MERTLWFNVFPNGFPATTIEDWDHGRSRFKPGMANGLLFRPNAVWSGWVLW